jgi:nucleoid DNA-binding protein
MSNNKLSFTELVDLIAQETGKPKSLIRDLLHEFISVTSDGLTKDGSVNVADLGRFFLKWYAERSGTNPKTGEDITVPGHHKVFFKPAKSIRDQVNKTFAHLQANKVDTAQVISESKPVVEKTVPLVSTASPNKVVAPVPKPAPVRTKKETPKKKENKRRRWLWLLLIIPILLILYLWPGLLKDEKVPDEPAMLETPVVQPEVIPITDSPDKDQNPVANDTLEQMPEEELSETKAEVESVPEPNHPGGTHITGPGDRFRVIAESFYDHAEAWPNIYRVNQDIASNPDLLYPGTRIQIPPLYGNKDSYTEKDMEQIAEGYILVYLAYKKLEEPTAKHYLWAVQKWGSRELLELYKTRIDPNDLQKNDQIDGFPNF